MGKQNLPSDLLGVLVFVKHPRGQGAENVIRGEVSETAVWH